MRGRRLLAAVDRLVSTSFAITGVIIAAMVLGVSYSALGRYLFNEPLRHVIEFSEYGLVFVLALGAAHIARNDGHVRVEVIDEFAPERIVRFLDRIAVVVTFLVACVLAYAVLRIGVNDLRTGAISEGFSQIPRAPLLLTAGVGFLIFAIERLATIIGWRDRGDTHANSQDDDAEVVG